MFYSICSAPLYFILFHFESAGQTFTLALNFSGGQNVPMILSMSGYTLLSALDQGVFYTNIALVHLGDIVFAQAGQDIREFVWNWRCQLGVFCILLVLSLVFTKSDKEADRKVKSLPDTGDTRLIYKWSVFDLAKTAFEPGHTEAVIQLVEKLNYDVNSVVPSNGLTLFLCACLSGERQLIKYMLHKGADVSKTTCTGDSAVYLATFGVISSPHPDVEVLDDLIGAGCSVNSANDSGYTALHRAAGSGNVDVIRVLMKHGADPYRASSLGIYPIDSAINNGHHQAAELLKVNVSNHHVWDVVDPHTPPHICLGLQSPQRKHLMDSTRRPCLLSPRYTSPRTIYR